MGDKKSFKDVLLNKVDTPVKAGTILFGLEHINKPCSSATFTEAEQIWNILDATLDTAVGFGLTASQIGISKRVALVKYEGKTYRLLNTRITHADTESVLYNEGCLSLPGKTVNTLRWENIIVEDDVQGTLNLSASSQGLLPAIIQHEVDHFEGITIFDRKRKPIRREGHKMGRNEKCLCGSEKKYKKCCGSVLPSGSR